MRLLDAQTGTDSRQPESPVHSDRSDRNVRWWGLLAALLGAQLLTIGIIYGYYFSYLCRAEAPLELCLFLSGSPLRAITLLCALLLFVLAKPRIRVLLAEGWRNNDRRHFWLRVEIIGFAVILVPWTFVANGIPAWLTLFGFVLWICGGVLAGIGAGFAMAGPQHWRAIARELGHGPIAILVAAIFVPEFTDIARGLWSIEPLTRATFEAVVATLNLFGVPAAARSADYILGTGTFSIAIGSQCSGVEGFALITLFLLCYFYAFSGSLRFPNVWVLLPLGLVFSWAFNVIRIAALFAIGLHISPYLAVNGFHSHAGWLMFSTLALSIIGVSQTIPWFQNRSRQRAYDLPIRADWNAACILPFAAFMAATLLLSTFTSNPDLWYVLKAVSMACALAVFIPLYRNKLQWRPDPLAAGAGIAIGLLWLVAGSATGGDDDALAVALADLPAWLLAGWIAVRLTGTIVLVPIVEELFFRGYVLQRLDRGGPAMRILAVAVSTGLFAMMHGRWILAAIAGLIFALLYLRRKRVTDAILAHAVSNALIGAVAFYSADWSLI